jgi:4-amino-4-deoxy-L-arabinose transferase-like glycosyltransferase
VPPLDPLARATFPLALGFFALVAFHGLREAPAAALVAWLLLLVAYPKRARFREWVEARSVWVIVGTGVALRAAWGFAAGVEPVSDFLVFWNDAGDLPDDAIGILRTTKSPLAVAYYGLLRLAFGDGLWPVYLSNAALGGLQILLVYALARELAPQAARLAAVLYAGLPSLIAFSSVVSSESPFLTFFLAGYYGLVRALRMEAWRPRLVLLLASGGLFALAHLSRSIGVVLFAATILVCAWHAALRPSRRWLAAAAAVGAFLLVLSPQIASNHLLYGELTLTNPRITMGSLLYGTSRENQGGYARSEWAQMREAGFHESSYGDEFRRFAREVRRVAIGRIRDDPASFAAFALGPKLARMWARDAPVASWSMRGLRRFRGSGPESGYTPFVLVLYGLCDAYYLFVIAACALAAVSLRRRNPLALAALALPVLAVASLHLLVEAQARYHVVVLPLLAVLAALGLAADASLRAPQPRAGSS